jgi:hypothetical protein
MLDNLSKSQTPGSGYIGSLGFSVIVYRIWGCERADTRSHPQIRGFTPPIPIDPIYHFTELGDILNTGPNS